MKEKPKYLYSCSLYAMDFDKFKQLLKEYKTVWLDKVFDNRAYLRPRMFFIEETFNKWLEFKKRTTSNYFYDNVKFRVFEYGSGKLKGVKTDVTFDILPSRETIEYKGKISCIDVKIIERMIVESPFQRYTFPTLDGMTSWQISGGCNRQIKTYLYEIKSKFGDVDISIIRKWGHNGVTYSFTIDSEEYHNKIREHQNIIQRCIDHDRACGYQYND